MSRTTSPKGNPPGSSEPQTTPSRPPFVDLEEIDLRVWEEGRNLKEQFPNATPEERLKKRFPE